MVEIQLLEFENNFSESLIIILDPPVIDYILMPTEKILVKIEKLPNSHNGEIVKFRYHESNVINVDMPAHSRIDVYHNNEWVRIWG